MKIYIPKNNDIRSRILEGISGTKEIDYTCNTDDFQFWKEIPEEEYDTMNMHSKEHEPGNILVFSKEEHDEEECFILDGLGYMRITFKP